MITPTTIYDNDNDDNLYYHENGDDNDTDGDSDDDDYHNYDDNDDDDEDNDDDSDNKRSIINAIVHCCLYPKLYFMWKYILLESTTFASMGPLYYVGHRQSGTPKGYISHWIKCGENIVNRTQVWDNGQFPTVCLWLSLDEMAQTYLENDGW